MKDSPIKFVNPSVYNNPISNWARNKVLNWYMRTDTAQEDINDALTEKSYDNVQGAEKYKIDDVIYTQDELKDYASKYEMDYTDYMQKMYMKGLNVYTEDITKDEELDYKINNAIKYSDNKIYNTDLDEKELETLNLTKGDKILSDDGVDVNTIYETEDGSYRRTRGTLTADEKANQMKEIYLDLINSDSYLDSFTENWTSKNANLVNNILIETRKKYDLSTEDGLEQAAKEANEKLNTLLTEAANNDKEYNARLQKYQNVLRDKFGPAIQERMLAEKRDDMIEGSWVGWFNDTMPDMARGVLKLGLGIGKSWSAMSSGTYGESINLLKSDNAIKYRSLGYDQDQKYYVGLTSQTSPKSGTTSYNYLGVADTEEEAIKLKDQLIKDYSLKRAELFAGTQEYQDKLMLLGSAEVFDKDGLTLDDYQEILANQGGQMILGSLSLGGSTFLQEGGNALQEMIDYHAADLAYPEIEDPKKRAEKYYSLSIEERIPFMEQAYNSGLIDFDGAMQTGGINAGLDLVGNFFVFAKAKKATKFLPKKFMRMFSKSAVKKFVEGGYKAAVKRFSKDYLGAIVPEVITENLQEATSMYMVDRSTKQEGLWKELFSADGLKLIMETSAQTALVPGTIVAGSKVTQAGYQIFDDQLQNYLAFKNPNHIRNYVNKQKRALKVDLDQGILDQNQYNDRMTQLELAERVFRNTKNKDVDGVNKQNIFNNLVDIQKINEELTELRKIKNPDQTVLGNIETLEQQIGEYEFENLKERLIGRFDQNVTLAEWVNSQKEGTFKDKSVKIFDTRAAARKYIKGKKIKSPLLKDVVNERGARNNGINLGDLAIIVKENVEQNIRDMKSLNANAAASNTIHHEVLHYITDNLSLDKKQELKDSLNLELMKSGLMNVAGIVDSRMKAYEKLYNSMVAKKQISKEAAQEALLGEYFSAVSDAFRVVDAADVSINPAYARALNSLANIMRNTLKSNIQGANIDLSTFKAGDMIKFMKSYNKFNGKNVIDLKLPDISVKGNQQVEEEVGKLSLAEDLSNQVQEIYNSDGLAGSMDILDLYKPMASKLANKYRDVPGFTMNRDILIDEILTGKRGILDLIMAYDPNSGVPLAAYINKYIGSRTIEAANRTLDKEFTTDVTEARGVAEQETTVQQAVKPTRNLRSSLNIEKDGTIYNKVKDAVVKTFGTRLPRIEAKEFKKKLQDSYRVELKKPIQDMMGTRDKFRMFLNNNFETIYNKLPQSTLNKRFKAFIQPVLDKDGKQVREKTAQGNAVFTKKDITKDEFVNYFIGANVGASTKGTRKDALAEAIAQELAFDATMEVVQDPDISNRFHTVNEIQGFVLPDNYLSELGRIIDRDPDAKFSIALSQAPQVLLDTFIADKSEFFALLGTDGFGFDKVGIRSALDFVFGDKFFGKFRTGIINDFEKILRPYTKAQAAENASVKKLPPVEKYVKDKETQLDDYLAVASMFGLQRGMSNYFGDKQQVDLQRVYARRFGQHLKDKYGPEKAIKLLFTYKHMFENGTGRGKRAMVFDRVADTISELLNKIDSKYTVTQEKQGTIKINGVDFKPATSQEKVTQSDIDGTTNFELADIKAKEAQAMLVDVFEFMAEMKNNDTFTSINAAMMVAGLLGNMKTVLRSSAAVRYVSTVLPTSNPKDFRYEHLIPARVVAFYMTERYFNGNKNINTQQLLNDYAVAIIPKTMDNAIGKYYGAIMPETYSIGVHPSVRYYNDFTYGEVSYAIEDKITGQIYGQSFADQYSNLQKVKKQNEKFSIRANNKSIQEQIEIFENMEKALEIAADPKAPIKGISVFDFDDTLATTKSKVFYTMPDGTGGSINATEFALQSAKLEEQGAVFDFSDFNKVVEGEKGPLADLALKRQNKFGSGDIFVLTARPQLAAGPIHSFLQGIGLDIPIENITGLENGTPEAKADWILGKAAKGYNNFYFADDAIKNVKAVKEVLDVIDVKNKVEQAKFSLNDDFNSILEDSTGVKSYKQYSKANAKRIGMKKRPKWRFFIPPNAEDFIGLLYDFLSPGKLGEQQMEFFDKHLIKPFAKAYKNMNTIKESISMDFRETKRVYRDVRKLLGKATEYKNFTYDQAIRVYIWNKLGMTIPGLSKQDQSALTKIVSQNQRLVDFANLIGKISRMREGYVQPSESWLGGSIASDLNEAVDRVGRKIYLRQWIENKNEIFSEQNMNKIEAIYGTSFADALKDILYRMEKGSNRPSGNSKVVNQFMTWVNNSVGAIMFLNMRSALLQTISSVNFINWGDNNILKAGLAFANQKQYWSDFTMIFNSPTLKQRRRGLKTDVNEAEIANAAAGAKNKAEAVLAYLLKIGFTPTQIADSFAISSGGATFYRNRVNTYLKQGFDKAKAEEKAFDDFLETSEKAQQSARPDLISPIQAGPLGRLIFAFQNTPMQYTRIIKKSMRDLIAGRGDAKTHISKILYYGAIQNIIFSGLQNAMFGMLFEDDEDEEVEEKYQKKSTRMLNNMVDTLLRGSGLYGAVASTAKNAIIKFIEQEKKDWGTDHTYTIIEIMNLSPPIGSKLRKIYSGIQSWRFNKEPVKEMGFDIDNPAWRTVTSIVSGTTNFPVDRGLQKLHNLKAASDSSNEAWQRIAVFLGWSTWDVGIVNKELEEIKELIKEQKRLEKLEKGPDPAEIEEKINKKIDKLLKKFDLE